MSKSLFKNATFFTTVDDLQMLPRSHCREVAFAGRSNVGKSSAINKLTSQTRLAYASKTPGRTQHINYFSLSRNRFLVDLPGYGYARVPSKIRLHWERLIGDYLQTREPLCGLILLMDVRRPFTDIDKIMLDWFLPTGKPVHILLTKTDKLTKEQAIKGLTEAQHIIARRYPGYGVQLFSSTKMTGVDEARNVIARWLD